jgi:hypothetical protein
VKSWPLLRKFWAGKTIQFDANIAAYIADLQLIHRNEDGAQPASHISTTLDTIKRLGPVHLDHAIHVVVNLIFPKPSSDSKTAHDSSWQVDQGADSESPAKVSPANHQLSASFKTSSRS